MDGYTSKYKLYFITVDISSIAKSTGISRTAECHCLAYVPTVWNNLLCVTTACHPVTDHAQAEVQISFRTMSVTNHYPRLF